jgi:hypothetical protein
MPLLPPNPESHAGFDQQSDDPYHQQWAYARISSAEPRPPQKANSFQSPMAE